MNSIGNSKDLSELTEVPNLVQQATIVASSINDISAYLGISKAKEIVSTITTSMNNLVKSFESLPDIDSQAYLLQGSL